MSGRRQMKKLFEYFIKLARRQSRFIKFAVVGGSGIFVNLGILFVLVEIAGLDKKLAAPSISLEVSIIYNFLMNNLWTFRDSKNKSHFLIKLLKFNLVSLIGFCLNLLIYNAVLHIGLYKIFGARDYLPCQLTAIFVVMFWNYFMNKRWTWGSKD
jgi:dolichol-phosphate mannosyltransferase